MFSHRHLGLLAVLLGETGLVEIRAAVAQDAPAGHAEVSLDQLHVEGPAGAGAGYRAARARSATKTDTALIDTPQAVTVVTREQIQDQGFQGVTEALRYVPGVFLHQGAANRDEIVIRGQQSSADFYVNGIRDDAQYFRDLYNVERIEVLKGPNAMIFGRGGGGGVVNRVLKEANGIPLREAFLQTGRFGTKRLALDVGDRVSDSVFFRLNGLFEDSGTFRDFVDLRRWGVNPTATVLLGPDTTLRLSYEYFHDARIADRGIPSQGGRPYRYRQNIRTFFGNPDLSTARVDAHIATASLEHRFASGVEMRSQVRFADYDKFYQIVYPSIRAGGAVNAAGTRLELSAFNNDTPRTNLFNQNDFTYRFTTGPLAHTLLAGFELGHQSGITYREDGFFATTDTQTLVVNPLSPVSRVPVSFRNLSSAANSRYDLGLAAVYAQDQIEIGPHLQIIGGLRYDHFDFNSTDRRTRVGNTRIDNLLSPRIGAVLKPFDALAFYANYSVSYLPSAGDQFTALSEGLAIAPPERFENREVGVKWDVTPALQLTGALYDLDRTNQRLADPNRPGFFLLSGQTNARGVEVGANGFLTDRWQVAGGYAFTDARIVNGFGSALILPGNRVGVVPFNAVTVWNKFSLTPELAVGLGTIHQTHTFASADNTVRLPGYTRFDLGLFYQVTDGIRAQINIENLFDRGYIATADGNNNISPGAPRLIRAQVVARF
ncbi:TonB-dependent receptor [Methylobacterium sp. Leaf104]|uniref:TonB-dependent receptor n=1 Tax=Methylobacterium TaxID=407 RepID=UPI0006FD9FD6|nr:MULTISPECIES: TonB-dependent siderophore receptor [Methylobacterium]KQP40885.1 TonB-dependent receptor [Methylobacterium sp. Leaf104]MCI9880915.1 TonB-dependent siderophore receptor [Methylobacterium goesingense]